MYPVFLLKLFQFHLNCYSLRKLQPHEYIVLPEQKPYLLKTVAKIEKV
jgi:hypothetical protein